MRRLLLLSLPLLLAGCSSQTSQNPSVAPTFAVSTNGKFETVAEINAEINRLYPPQLNNRTLAKVIEVVTGILDGARTDKTALAVKDWTFQNSQMASSMTDKPTPRIEAGNNSFKWLAAAADAKAAQLKGETPASDYEADKKNALSEAAKADSLPIQ